MRTPFFNPHEMCVRSQLESNSVYVVFLEPCFECLAQPCRESLGPALLGILLLHLHLFRLAYFLDYSELASHLLFFSQNRKDDLCEPEEVLHHRLL